MSKSLCVTANIENLDTTNYSEATELELLITVRTRTDKLVYASENLIFQIDSNQSNVSNNNLSFIIPNNFNGASENDGIMFHNQLIFLTARLKMSSSQGFRTLVRTDYQILKSLAFEKEIIPTQTTDYPYFKGIINLSFQQADQKFYLFKTFVGMRIPQYRFAGLYLCITSEDGRSAYYYSNLSNSGNIIFDYKQLSFQKKQVQEPLILKLYGAFDELPNHEFLIYSINLEDQMHGSYSFAPYKINQNFNQLISFYLKKFDLLRNNQQDSILKQQLYNISFYYNFMFYNVYKQDSDVLEFDLGVRERELKFVNEFEQLHNEMKQFKEKVTIERALICFYANVAGIICLYVPSELFCKSTNWEGDQQQTDNQFPSVQEKQNYQFLAKKQQEIFVFLKEQKFQNELVQDFVDYFETDRNLMNEPFQSILHNNNTTQQLLKDIDSGVWAFIAVPINMFVGVQFTSISSLDSKVMKNIKLQNNDNILFGSFFCSQDQILGINLQEYHKIAIYNQNFVQQNEVVVDYQKYQSANPLKFIKMQQLNTLIYDKDGLISQLNSCSFKVINECDDDFEISPQLLKHVNTKLFVPGNSFKDILNYLQNCNRYQFSYELYKLTTKGNYNLKYKSSLYFNIKSFSFNQQVSEVLEMQEISFKFCVRQFFKNQQKLLDFSTYLATKSFIKIARSIDLNKFNYFMNYLFEIQFSFDGKKISEYEEQLEDTYEILYLQECFRKFIEVQMKLIIYVGISFDVPDKNLFIDSVRQIIVDKQFDKLSINQIVQYMIQFFEQFQDQIKFPELHGNYQITFEGDSNIRQLIIQFEDGTTSQYYSDNQKFNISQINDVQNLGIKNAQMLLDATTFRIFPHGIIVDIPQTLFVQEQKIKYHLSLAEANFSWIDVRIFFINLTGQKVVPSFSSSEYVLEGKQLSFSTDNQSKKFMFANYKIPSASEVKLQWRNKEKMLLSHEFGTEMQVSLPYISILGDKFRFSELVLLQNQDDYSRFQHKFNENVVLPPKDAVPFNSMNLVNQTLAAANMSRCGQIYQYVKQIQTADVVIVFNLFPDILFVIDDETLDTKLSNLDFQKMDLTDFTFNSNQLFCFKDVDFHKKITVSALDTSTGSIKSQNFTFEDFNICYGIQDYIYTEIISGLPCSIVDLNSKLKTAFYCDMKISQKVRVLLNMSFEQDIPKELIEPQDLEEHLIKNHGKAITNIKKEYIEGSKLFNGKKLYEFLETRIQILKQSRQRDFFKFVLYSIKHNDTTDNQFIQSIIFANQQFLIMQFQQMLNSRQFITANSEMMKMIRVLFKKLQISIQDEIFQSVQQLDDYVMYNFDIFEKVEVVLQHFIKCNRPFIEELFETKFINFNALQMLPTDKLQGKLQQLINRNESQQLQLLLGFLLHFQHEADLLNSRIFAIIQPNDYDYLKQKVSILLEQPLEGQSTQEFECFIRENCENKIFSIQRILTDGFLQTKVFGQVIFNIQIVIDKMLQGDIDNIQLRQYVNQFTNGKLSNPNIICQLLFIIINKIQQWIMYLQNRKFITLDQQNLQRLQQFVNSKLLSPNQFVQEKVNDTKELEEKLFSKVETKIISQFTKKMLDEGQVSSYFNCYIGNPKRIISNYQVLVEEKVVESIFCYNKSFQTMIQVVDTILDFQQYQSSRVKIKANDFGFDYLMKQMQVTQTQKMKLFAIKDSLMIEDQYIDQFDFEKLVPCIRSFYKQGSTNDYLNALYETDFYNPSNIIDHIIEKEDPSVRLFLQNIRKLLNENQQLSVNQTVQILLYLSSNYFTYCQQLKDRIFISMSDDCFHQVVSKLKTLITFDCDAVNVRQLEDRIQDVLPQQQLLNLINLLYKVDFLQNICSEQIYSFENCFSLSKNVSVIRDTKMKYEFKQYCSFNEYFQLCLEIIHCVVLFENQQRSRQFILKDQYDFQVIQPYFSRIKISVPISVDCQYSPKQYEDALVSKDLETNSHLIYNALRILHSDSSTQIETIMQCYIYQTQVLINNKLSMVADQNLKTSLQKAILSIKESRPISFNMQVQLFIITIIAYRDFINYLNNRLFYNDGNSILQQISQIFVKTGIKVSKFILPSSKDLEDHIYECNDYQSIVPKLRKYVLDIKNLLPFYSEKIKDPDSLIVDFIQTVKTVEQKQFLAKVRTQLEQEEEVSQNQIVQYTICVIHCLLMKENILKHRYFIDIKSQEWDALLSVLSDHYLYKMEDPRQSNMNFVKCLEDQVTLKQDYYNLKQNVLNLLEQNSIQQEQFFGFKTNRLYDFVLKQTKQYNEIIGQKLFHTYQKLIDGNQPSQLAENDIFQLFVVIILCLLQIQSYRSSRKFLISQDRLQEFITFIKQQEIIGDQEITTLHQLDDIIFNLNKIDIFKQVYQQLIDARANELALIFGEEIFHQIEIIQSRCKLDCLETSKLFINFQKAEHYEIVQSVIYFYTTLNDYSQMLAKRYFVKATTLNGISAVLQRLQITISSNKLQDCGNDQQLLSKMVENMLLQHKQQQLVINYLIEIFVQLKFDQLDINFPKQFLLNKLVGLCDQDKQFLYPIININFQNLSELNDNQQIQLLFYSVSQLCQMNNKLQRQLIILIPDKQIQQLVVFHIQNWQLDISFKKILNAQQLNQMFYEYFTKNDLETKAKQLVMQYDDDFDIRSFIQKVTTPEIRQFLLKTYDCVKDNQFDETNKNGLIQLSNFVMYSFLTKQILQIDHSPYLQIAQLFLFNATNDLLFLDETKNQHQILLLIKQKDNNIAINIINSLKNLDYVNLTFRCNLESIQQFLLIQGKAHTEESYINRLINKVFGENKKISLIQQVDFILFAIGVFQKNIIPQIPLQFNQQEIQQIIYYMQTRMNLNIYIQTPPKSTALFLQEITANKLKSRNVPLTKAIQVLQKSELVPMKEGALHLIELFANKIVMLQNEALCLLMNVAQFRISQKPQYKVDLQFTKQQLVNFAKWIKIFGFQYPDFESGDQCVQCLEDDQNLFIKMLSHIKNQQPILVDNVYVPRLSLLKVINMKYQSGKAKTSEYVNESYAMIASENAEKYRACVYGAVFYSLLRVQHLRVQLSYPELNSIQRLFESHDVYWSEVAVDIVQLEEMIETKYPGPLLQLLLDDLIRGTFFNSQPVEELVRHTLQKEHSDFSDICILLLDQFLGGKLESRNLHIVLIIQIIKVVQNNFGSLQLTVKQPLQGITNQDQQL